MESLGWISAFSATTHNERITVGGFALVLRKSGAELIKITTRTTLIHHAQELLFWSLFYTILDCTELL